MIREFVIPRCEARAFEILEGQPFRVVAIEGKQVGDMTILNLHDFRETFNAQVTNSAAGRCLSKASKLYSGPPRFNSMLSVVNDPVGVHWVHGRCTRFMFENLFDQKNHPNCHDNLTVALEPHGVDEFMVPFSTFNIFMRAHLDDSGYYVFDAPPIEAGDFIEFRADMDVLVAISACPDDTVINDYNPKPLKVEIHESNASHSSEQPGLQEV